MTRDGIRTSGRPPGPLGTRWLLPLEACDERVRDRLLRGKTLARAGRIFDLDMAPGQAFAEVEDAGDHRACIRVVTYDEEQWVVIVAALTARLDRLAGLIEGDLSLELVDAVERGGVALFPRVEEIEADCDCGDWAVPCAHVAALHHLVAEGLDGDPLLLFTLRGRTREQLFAELRRWYGDLVGNDDPGMADPEPVPPGDPKALAEPLSAMTFRFGATAPQPGLAELGPLEGDVGLDRILAPLYAAGATAAVELALAERPGALRRRRRPPSTPPPPPQEPVSDTTHPLS